MSLDQGAVGTPELIFDLREILAHSLDLRHLALEQHPLLEEFLVLREIDAALRHFGSQVLVLLSSVVVRGLPLFRPLVADRGRERSKGGRLVAQKICRARDLLLDTTGDRIDPILGHRAFRRWMQLLDRTASGSALVAEAHGLGLDLT